MAAYTCPRCGEPVLRCESHVVEHLVAILFGSNDAPFHCVTCGTIPLSEFPANVQRRANWAYSLLWFICLLIVLLGPVIAYALYRRCCL